LRGSGYVKKVSTGMLKLDDRQKGVYSLKGTKKVPFPRSYWVVPGKLLAGCYPGSENPEEARIRMRALLDHGMRHFLDLMEPGEFNWNGKPFVPYAPRLKAMADERGVETTFDRLAIRDGWVPSRAFMSHILDRIDLFSEEDKPVYIHCWGGRGRTGTVVGCYLARHGLALGYDVLDLIAELRKNTEDHDEISPESFAQIDFVVSWLRGE
jgi:hypothetical protein